MDDPDDADACLSFSPGKRIK